MYPSISIFCEMTCAIWNPCATITDLNLVAAITVGKKKHHAGLDIFLSSSDQLESIRTHLIFDTPVPSSFLGSAHGSEYIGELLLCLRSISFLDLNFANYNLGELGLLGILLSFVCSRLPIEDEDKSGSRSDASRVEISLLLCDKREKHFESFGVKVLRDGMISGYVTNWWGARRRNEVDIIIINHDSLCHQ